MSSRSLRLSPAMHEQALVESRKGAGPGPTGSRWFPFAESARGISPRAAHRTGRKPLDLSGSCHPLKAAAFPSKPASSSCFQLTQFDLNAGDLLPSLHGHYPASPLLQSSPPLSWCISTFGLAVLPLVPFPLPSPARLSSSARKPRLESRLLYTGHRMASK